MLKLPNLTAVILAVLLSGFFAAGSRAEDAIEKAGIVAGVTGAIVVPATVRSITILDSTYAAQLGIDVIPAQRPADEAGGSVGARDSWGIFHPLAGGHRGALEVHMLEKAIHLTS